MIIWLEGPDGAGKTTTAHKLYDMMAEQYRDVCHAYHVDCVTYKASEVVQSNSTGGNPVKDAALNGVLIADRCTQISYAIYTHALPERDWAKFEPPPAPPIPYPHIKQMLWVAHGVHKIPHDFTYGEIFRVKRAYRALAKTSCPDHLARYMPVVSLALETYPTCEQHGTPYLARVSTECWRGTLSGDELLEAVAVYATSKGVYGTPQDVKTLLLEAPHA